MTLGRKTKGAKKSSNRRIVESWEEEKIGWRNRKKSTRKGCQKRPKKKKNSEFNFRGNFRGIISRVTKNHTVHSSIQVLPILKYFQKATPDLQRLWEI